MEEAGWVIQHDQDVYLAHLIVLPGQLVSRIVCSNGELILGLLIISSVGPLLRMSEGGLKTSPENNVHSVSCDENFSGDKGRLEQVDIKTF